MGRVEARVKLRALREIQLHPAATPGQANPSECLQPILGGVTAKKFAYTKEKLYCHPSGIKFNGN
jgi:hypothetical protein